VSLIADGVAVSEIVSGLNRAIASRIVALVRRVAPASDSLAIAMSGGVAHNHGVVRALSQAFGTQILVPPKPDTVGALGAALIAREKAMRG
jgi:activator of 2-hydroxyglutaryl-CoA dehydratase